MKLHMTFLKSLTCRHLISIMVLVTKKCRVKNLMVVPFLLFSTEHTLGHIFAITTAVNNGTFNEDICISSGFMLAEMISGQGMIVLITALSG